MKVYFLEVSLASRYMACNICTSNVVAAKLWNLNKHLDIIMAKTVSVGLIISTSSSVLSDMKGLQIHEQPSS